MTRTRPRTGKDEAIDALRRWLDGNDGALEEWLAPPRRDPPERAFPA